MEVIISQLTRRLGAPPNVYLKHRSYHIAAIAIGEVQKNNPGNLAGKTRIRG